MASLASFTTWNGLSRRRDNPFHLVKLANDTVTKVRRRVTWENRDRRGRKADPEWANRRRLLTARERLPYQRFARMWNECMDADESGQVIAAWIAKEELRGLLATAARGGNRADIAHHKYRFHAWCAQVDIPEVTTLAETIETLVARDRGVLPHPHHQRRNRRRQPAHQRRRPARLRLQKPREPSTPGTVPLHPAITPEPSARGAIAPSKLKSPDVVVIDLDLAQVARSDRAHLDRHLIRPAGTVVCHRDGVATARIGSRGNCHSSLPQSGETGGGAARWYRCRCHSVFSHVGVGMAVPAGGGAHRGLDVDELADTEVGELTAVAAALHSAEGQPRVGVGRARGRRPHASHWPHWPHWSQQSRRRAAIFPTRSKTGAGHFNGRGLPPGCSLRPRRGR
jgi:hypothetical protein